MGIICGAGYGIGENHQPKQECREKVLKYYVCGA